MFMRLLLADDEKELTQAIAVILKHHHYLVDVVDNGEDALYYLTSQHYDGAILDIMMPQKDGLSVLKEMRKQGIDTPVLMLTAKSDVDDCVIGLDNGADDYLGKPFAMKELLARIRAITRRKNDNLSIELQYGNIILNQSTFSLTCNNQHISLTNKEYQMMEIFLRNPHQIISTERLMENIWGYDSDTDIHVVWVYISYLRKKLLKLNANVKIKAVRNLGYCLEVMT